MKNRHLPPSATAGNTASSSQNTRQICSTFQLHGATAPTTSNRCGYTSALCHWSMRLPTSHPLVEWIPWWRANSWPAKTLHKSLLDFMLVGHFKPAWKHPWLDSVTTMCQAPPPLPKLFTVSCFNKRC